MRVAVYYNNRDIRIEERHLPRIGRGEMLVRVEASGICGSDVMEWYRRDKAPLVLGHEVAGVIAEVGEGVERYTVGQRVALAHHVPCNTCHYCLSRNHTVCDTLRKTNFDPGGFAECLRLPAINVDRGVFVLPDEVSFEEGSFVEPLACVLRGQRKVGLQPGQSVLVIGSGISGILHVQLASALGAGPVVATDIVDFRLKRARQLGASETIHAQDDISARMKEINNGRLADLVILCTGARQVIERALKVVERGGTLLLFAPSEPGFFLPLPVNEFFFNGIKLVSSYAGSPADYNTALELLRQRRVRAKEMITHRLTLEETGKGFQVVAEAGESLKVIVEPQKHI